MSWKTSSSLGKTGRLSTGPTAQEAEKTVGTVEVMAWFVIIIYIPANILLEAQLYGITDGFISTEIQLLIVLVTPVKMSTIRKVCYI